MDRFTEPRATDDFHDCECCGGKFHYTSLNNEGLCSECKKDTEEE